MLLPHLYKIQSSLKIDEKAYEFMVEINPAHPLFKGHFPQRPILPGVCTIQIVKECICSVIDKELHFMSITQCKFMRMVDPNIDNKLIVSITINTDSPTEIIVNSTIINSNVNVFKIKAALTEPRYDK